MKDIFYLIKINFSFLYVILIIPNVYGQELNITSDFSNISTNNNVFGSTNKIIDGDQFSYVTVNNPASITLSSSSPRYVSRITFLMRNIDHGNISYKSNGVWYNSGSFSAFSFSTQSREINAIVEAIKFSNILEDERGRIYEVSVFEEDSPEEFDLQVQNVDIFNAEAGDYASTNISITNLGNGSTGEFYVGFYLSEDGVLSSDDLEISEMRIPNINGGQNQTITPIIRIPNDYYNKNITLLVEADSRKMIEETNENNNIKNKYFFVAPSFPTQCEGRITKNSIDWDWRAESYQALVFGLSNNKTSVDIPSPWFSTNTNNSNINQFRIQNPKDFDPNDGWVLVQKDFGSVSTNEAVNHPYFILYNKFTGTLRVFVALSKDIGSSNSAVISLSLLNSSTKTAILEHHSQSEYKNALDNFDVSIPPINVPNSYAFQNPTYWLHADFSMAYDPCTCNSLSQMVFDVKLVNQANLTFETNGKAIQDLDVTGKSGDDQQQSVTETLLDNGDKIIDAGVSFHKSTKKGLDVVKEVFPSINYAEEPLYNKIPGFGAAIGVANFIVGLFTDKPKEVIPLVLDIDLKSEGNIEYSVPFRETILEIPGSDNEFLVPPTLINYNNILGIFNLLETPVITKSETTISGKDWRKSRLGSNPKFVINPAAGFDPDDLNIKASYVIEHQGQSSFFHDNPEIDWVQLEDNGIKEVWQTELFDIACIKDITLRFRYNSFTKVHLKIVASLETFNGKQTIYASTFKTSTAIHPGGYGDSDHWINTGINCSGQLNAVDPLTHCENRLSQLNSRISSSINDLSSNEDVNTNNLINQVFPNPTSDKLNVILNLEKESIIDIKLSDITGSFIKVLVPAVLLESGLNEFIFDISSLDNGIYILEVNNEFKDLSRKRLLINR